MENYDEFDLVIKELISQKDITSKDENIIISIKELQNKKIGPELFYKILKKLQKEENILNVLRVPENIVDNLLSFEIGKRNDVFEIEIKENFDNWYSNYLLKKKQRLENMDYIPFLKVLDVIISINHQLQTSADNKVIIPVIPPLILFKELLAVDSPATRDMYIKNRVDGLKYLINLKAISNYDVIEHPYDRWQNELKLTVDLIEFEKIFQRADLSYKERHKGLNKNQFKQKPTTSINKDTRVENKVFHEIKYTNNKVIYNGVEISSPSFNGENDLVMKYLYENPNREISKQELEEKATKQQITKSLHKIVENLGFKRKLRKLFIKVSTDTIYFRNPITEQQLKELDLE